MGVRLSAGERKQLKVGYKIQHNGGKVESGPGFRALTRGGGCVRYFTAGGGGEIMWRAKVGASYETQLQLPSSHGCR